jgi:hypothetical protein
MAAWSNRWDGSSRVEMELAVVMASQPREGISRGAADATFVIPTKSFSALHEESLKRSSSVMARHLTANSHVQRHPGLPDCAIGFLMREDLTSSSFLAVIVVGLSVVCAGLIVLGL